MFTKVRYLVRSIAQIAMKEFREKKIPFTIRRYLPDGRYITIYCLIPFLFLVLQYTLFYVMCFLFLQNSSVMKIGELMN
jgi:hypothetical protein